MFRSSGGSIGVLALAFALTGCDSEPAKLEQPQKDQKACEYVSTASEGEGLITSIEAGSDGTSLVHLDWQATGTEVTRLVLPVTDECIADEGYSVGLSVAVDRFDPQTGRAARAAALLCAPAWVKLPDVFADSCQVYREKGAGAFVELR
jgi:hypothetical protein